MRISVLILIASVLAGCSYTIKEGGPAKVDPLTRKEYKVVPR